MTFVFFSPDYDRSCGWTNHGMALQRVCAGGGDTPEEAWRDAQAQGAVPEDFELPSEVIAIPANAMKHLTVAP